MLADILTYSTLVLGWVAITVGIYLFSGAIGVFPVSGGLLLFSLVGWRMVFRLFGDGPVILSEAVETDEE